MSGCDERYGGTSVESPVRWSRIWNSRKTFHSALEIAGAAAGIGGLRDDFASARDQDCVGQLRPVIHEARSHVAGESQGGDDDRGKEGSAHVWARGSRGA